MFTYSVSINRKYELPKFLLKTKDVHNAARTARVLWDHRAPAIIQVYMGGFVMCTLFGQKHVDKFMEAYYASME